MGSPPLPPPRPSCVNASPLSPLPKYTREETTPPNNYGDAGLRRADNHRNMHTTPTTISRTPRLSLSLPSSLASPFSPISLPPLLRAWQHHQPARAEHRLSPSHRRRQRFRAQFQYYILDFGFRITTISTISVLLSGGRHRRPARVELQQSILLQRLRSPSTSTSNVINR